jgi:hypothetical protein
MTVRLVIVPGPHNYIQAGFDCSPIEYAFCKPRGCWYRVHTKFCPHYSPVANEHMLRLLAG